MIEESMLSEDDHAFWCENGYVVIKDVVPEELLEGVRRAIWTHLGVDGEGPDDWYSVPPRKNNDRTGTSPPITGGGGVKLSAHQPALWATRQYPKVHRVFTEILGTEKLWASFDRANMKPPVRPENPEWDQPGLPVHWDLDTIKVNPVPLTVQGVLCLTDTDENQGGFVCAPGFHKKFDDWVQTQPADRKPRHPGLEKDKLTPVPGKAGDLIVWHRLVPHANGRNSSNKPRMAQYITMFPARDDEALRQERINSWCHDLPMRSTKSQEFDIRDQEEDLPEPQHVWDIPRDKKAVLTDLGRKLVGLDLW